jgi:uncharacterized membrane protein
VPSGNVIGIASISFKVVTTSHLQEARIGKILHKRDERNVKRVSDENSRSTYARTFLIAGDSVVSLDIGKFKKSSIGAVNGIEFPLVRVDGRQRSSNPAMQ